MTLPLKHAASCPVSGPPSTGHLVFFADNGCISAPRLTSESKLQAGPHASLPQMHDLASTGPVEITFEQTPSLSSPHGPGRTPQIKNRSGHSTGLIAAAARRSRRRLVVEADTARGSPPGTVVPDRGSVAVSAGAAAEQARAQAPSALGGVTPNEARRLSAAAGGGEADPARL